MKFICTAVVLGALAAPFGLSIQSASAHSCDLVTPGLKRDDAFDCPSKHAWDLFVAVNQPAQDMSIGRGLPDPSKKLGSPGMIAVWETWRLATPEVFKEDGSKPPEDYNDLSLIPVGTVHGKVPELPKRLLMAKGVQQSRTVTNKFAEEGIFRGAGGFGESRMNRATYDFVVKQKLWNLNQLQQYAAAVAAGKREPISLPSDSMEVKASWYRFTDADLAAGKEKTYYAVELPDENGKQQKFGLTGLHILTKDSPNWFWTTFHHKDQPNSGFETPDVLGPPPEVSGTVWANYKLGGAQTDFVTSTGMPTKLSDAYIEKGFTDSSCISCHANASASVNGRGLGSDTKAMGKPDSTKFFSKSGKPLVTQLDFLFSIAFRAQPEKAK